MTELVRYDAACRALAEAKSVDEVKDIRDKAEALRAYAKMAKDTQLEMDAAEIRLRAERRLGIMLTEQKRTVGMNRGGWKESCGSNSEPQVGVPTLADMGIDKKLSMRSQKVGGIAEPSFEALIDTMRQDIRTGRSVSLDLLKGIDKKEQRATRERELGEFQQALPDQKFGVIVADPEWQFEPWSRETGMDRAADNHYPTSCTEVIAARDVPSIAAKDCILFLCATAPMLPHALLVMAAWGFDYRSNYVLVKDRVITGYWNRNKHEHLLIGVKGNIPCPAPGTQWDSLIDAPVNKHSAKPEAMLEMIEQYFPTLPKIELNRRGAPRPGWSAWGNEVSRETSVDA